MPIFRVAVFSAKTYDKQSFDQQVPANVRYEYLEPRLSIETVKLADGFDAICAFVNDDLNAEVLSKLKEYGVKALVLRCAGFNNVDMEAAQRLGLRVARVPAYSPEAVAEHTLALILTLNRKLHKAYNRTKEDNFSLQGLLGFNLNGKTVGLIGTGKIGLATARIFNGFGVTLLASDPFESDNAIKLGLKYVSFETLIKQADIISLHCPLNEETQHIIDCNALNKMKAGVMIVNTGRGALIDSQCLIENLKSGKIGYLALDVYEQESELFFEDRSDSIIHDDVFQRLLTFPNVLITGHQGFFTKEALSQIANTTHYNLQCFATNKPCDNEL